MRTMVLLLAALALVWGVPAAEASGTKVKVPDVRQMEVERAVRVLQRAGLSARLLGASGSGTKFVVGQNPAPGREVKTGTRVRLSCRVARDGQAAPTAPGTSRTVEVPRVIGLSRTQAQARLQRLGLGSRVVGSTEGTVVGQNPTAGSRVRRGTQVRISLRAVRR